MLLNNIMLKMDNSTVQIDHLVISKYGIFVIETKNYGGLIIGNKYDDNWFQYLGRNKSLFHSPLRQNYGHIKCLSSILGIDESKFISNEDLILLKDKIISLNITNKKDRKEHNRVIKDRIKDNKFLIDNDNVQDVEVR